jgi:hypothetical protein
VMQRHELLERLAPLIPPPRAHQIRFHGVLAPCASARDRVVPNLAGGIEARGRARPIAAIETDLAALLGPPVERSENLDRVSLDLICDPDASPCASDPDAMRRRPLPEPPSMAGP